MEKKQKLRMGREFVYPNCHAVQLQDSDQRLGAINEDPGTSQQTFGKANRGREVGRPNHHVVLLKDSNHRIGAIDKDPKTAPQAFGQLEKKGLKTVTLTSYSLYRNTDEQKVNPGSTGGRGGTEERRKARSFGLRLGCPCFYVKRSGNASETLIRRP